jgi:hypothetical protein
MVARKKTKRKRSISLAMNSSFLGGGRVGIEQQGVG